MYIATCMLDGGPEVNWRLQEALPWWGALVDSCIEQLLCWNCRLQPPPELRPSQASLPPSPLITLPLPPDKCARSI